MRCTTRALDDEDKAIASSWQLLLYEAEMPMAPSDITVLSNEQRCLASKESSVEVSKTIWEERSRNNLGVTVDNARDIERETRGKELMKETNSNPEARQTGLHI